MPIQLNGLSNSSPTNAELDNSIAIVGMAVNLPGAPNTAKLWEVLEKGINTCTEIPEFRFKVSEYNPPNHINPKRIMKAHTGNFIDDVDVFDNQFFKISPREARSMDPQQRILLHTAYEALEDAGYVPDSTPSFSRESFGCYIGNGGQDYIQNLRNEVDAYYLMGTLRAFLSGRTSYVMQMGGPSITVDTGCSSSMIAIYQAARALITRDCNAVIAGGVNIFTSPDRFLGLDRAHFLSPTGQSKPFDSTADGYSRGEGCGVFILKRLADAIAENDNIQGVMRSVEVNHSGTSHSITHPHAPTQLKLWKRLVERSGIPADRINVVEAHGTGTQAGDPTEMSSVRSVLGATASGRKADNPLYITSVKANIGHQESASASSGMAKILLMLKYKTIPRHISFKNLNPRIPPIELDHIRIPTEDVKWEPAPKYSNQPRVALLSNFGAAGSNSGAIIEEYVPPTRFTAPLPADQDLIFGLSAKTEKALLDLRTKFIDWLDTADAKSLRLADIAYTTTARRIIYPYRISVVANSREELVKKLQSANPSLVQLPQAATNEHAHDEEESGEVAGDEKQKLVFVFSGQGVQYIGMGKSLYQSSRLFKNVIDECHTILKKNGFPGVLSILTSEGETSGLGALEEFEAYQAAIFALEYALAKLWMSWGVEPSAVVGHSLGEYAALVIAEVLSLEDALMIVANRVRLMVQKCSTDATGMMAVALSGAQVEELIKGSGAKGGFSDVTVSCINSPTDSVVSGPKTSLKALKEHIDQHKPGCKNTVLGVPFGYHSSAMSPLLTDLTKIVERKITISSPTLPIISNLYGKLITPGDNTAFNAAYFARHCAEPVQFEAGIRSLLSSPLFEKVDAWIEVGPHASLLPMLKWNPLVGKAGNGVLLPSLRKQQSPWSTLSSSLSQLFVSSNIALDINWRSVFGQLTDDSVSCVSLPTYPFARNKFWVGFKEETGAILEDDYVEEMDVDESSQTLQNGNAKKNELDGLKMPDQIVHIVSETCAVDVADVNVNTELVTLGFDSMMSIELMEKLNDIYVGANFDHHALQACHAVSDIVKQVSVRMGLPN
ncbi:ketoacyl-synt-domain-containing protein [Dendrothele bispora CBS 962.96]|uniref:Ketoacyl-synt-domain-containing protein n=1 Tax=Dendrothele bispora (strain CBS 962.96) TaxID=1314807 RepID=A0A4S8L720_DENBC|nr:ketoacyl-synt-domain-containing protein [Dendrothele bispora CBS 962.96]